MRAKAALFVIKARLHKSHRAGTVDQVAFAGEFAAISRGGPHKAGFHLDGDHTHVFLNAARCCGHRDIKQRHASPAVSDCKGVQVRWFGCVANG